MTVVDSISAESTAAHWHLSSHELLAGATFGHPAAQHVALGDPERATLGT
jgi:hypothetical protein